MKNLKLTRLELTGRTKFITDSSSVSQEDLVNAAGWAKSALNADMDYMVKLNVPEFMSSNNIYRAVVESDWGALNCTIYNEDLSTPLLTFTITNDEQYDISKWEVMNNEYGNVAEFSKPPLPWCASVFHSGFYEDTGNIADWSSQFENQIAWAWILDMIPNVDKFAKYAN